ncbi:uncharacterized protein G2W53_024510 [Senna tora]|uniref:Uncharacterized protein n=1 Tax=Senna tora TaxID=362788 RepID=A0A834TDI3_9FABA|nr:uncharacterized protein G2W53_024510 [Senna tora]
MAWDLWSSTYDQVVHDSNYSEHFGWQCDFYFGFGRDVIEEDALNEKYCIQVLRNLIRKADTEIEKLERDLLSLQNELACAEQQNFPEICCSVLSEKINLLEVSIGSLKNDHADNTEIQLLLHNKPAEALHEILKAAQRDNCQDKCGQPLDVNTSNLNPSISKHAVDQESSNINSNILIKEEQNEVCAENSASSKLLVELHKKRSDCPTKIETANTNVKDASSGSLKLAAVHPKEEKILTVYNSGGTEEEQTKEHVAAEDGSLIENILVCPEEKRCSPEADKVREALLFHPPPSPNQSLPSVLVKRRQSYTSVAAHTMNLCSVLKPKEKRITTSKWANVPAIDTDSVNSFKELLTKTVMRSPDLGPIICAPGPDRMNLLGTSDLKILANEEVRRSQFIAYDTVQILNSFSSEGKRNIPKEAKQEDAIVKDVTAEALGLAAGIEGREKCVDSKLHDSQRAKSESSDLEQKLCDFAPKTARRECKKESKVPSTLDLDAMNLPNNRECKRTAPLQIVATQELCLTNPELCSLKGMNRTNSLDVMNTQSAGLLHAKNSVFSLLDMQTAGAHFTCSQLTDEGKSRALCLKPETTANLGKSVIKRKNQGKRKLESDAVAGELVDSPIEVISNSSKRQRKSRTSIGGANLDESLKRKVTKRVVQPSEHDTEHFAIVPYDSNFSELQKRRNVNVDMPNSKGVDSCSETSAWLPIGLELEKLSLPNLRAIAKKHKDGYTASPVLPQFKMEPEFVDQLGTRDLPQKNQSKVDMTFNLHYYNHVVVRTGSALGIL